jgi:MoaA/NifB/PqqE/SkfB family radical SAM enzyme
MSLIINSVRSYLRHPAYIRHLIRLKLKLRSRYRWVLKHPEADAAVPPPLIYKFLLTYRCNARCGMCMQWGDEGWCREDTALNPPGEFPWDSLQAVIEEAAPRRPDFVLSGGEPLLYSRFAELTELLRRKRCFAIVCTNGLRLDACAELFDRNPYLVPLVSLDGFAEQNDRLRGEGGYRKVIENLAMLKALRQPPYLGVQFTIQPENVGVMHAFCREMTALGADWILLNPRWFIRAGV